MNRHILTAEHAEFAERLKSGKPIDCRELGGALKPPASPLIQDSQTAGNIPISARSAFSAAAVF
jgi:hypothetical protein